MSSDFFDGYYDDQYDENAESENAYVNQDPNAFDDHPENAYVNDAVNAENEVDSNPNSPKLGEFLDEGGVRLAERKTSKTQTTLSRGIVLSLYDEDMYSLPVLPDSPPSTQVTSSSPTIIQQTDSFDETMDRSRYFNYLSSRRRSRPPEQHQTFKPNIRENRKSIFSCSPKCKKVASIVVGTTVAVGILSIATYFLVQVLGKNIQIRFSLIT